MQPSQQAVEEDIRAWSKQVLEVPNPHLNGMKACPYAEAAWRDNKVSIDFGHTLLDLKRVIINFDPVKKDLAIWASCNVGRYDLWDRWVSLWNAKNNQHDLHLMLFHPDFPPQEDTENFLTDNTWESIIEEDYMMVFIQQLSVLNKASLALEKTGYYNSFSDDLYQSLVVNRRRQ